LSTDRTGDFIAGPGGVWTEVGSITGVLTLRIEVSNDLALTPHVRYQQADTR
jgi:hypothetical protein